MFLTTMYPTVHFEKEENHESGYAVSCIYVIKSSVLYKHRYYEIKKLFEVFSSTLYQGGEATCFYIGD